MDNNKNELPDISGIFNIDEKKIPKKAIEKPVSSAPVTKPILTSEEAIRSVKKSDRTALEKHNKKEQKTKKKMTRRLKMIVVLAGALAFLLIVSFSAFLIEDSKKPVITVQKPIEKTISRYYETDAVVLKNQSGFSVAFVDNDYDVHYLEKGQAAEIKLSEEVILNGTVTQIKEELPESDLISKNFTVLTDTLPSTAVYAVYITVTDTVDTIPEQGTVVKTKVLTKTAENALTIPSSALFANGTQYYVWLYSPFSKEITKQDVNIGITVDEETQITAGLQKSDKVAVTFSCPGAALYDKMKVKSN